MGTVYRTINGDISEIIHFPHVHVGFPDLWKFKYNILLLKQHTFHFGRPILYPGAALL